MSRPLATPMSKLLDTLVFQYGGTGKEFARAAKLTRPQLSHFMNPRAGDRPPGLLVCLRIAKAGHCSPLRVLRAAGHLEVAELLEDYFGATPEARAPGFGAALITGAQRAFLDDMRRLSPRLQKAITLLIHTALAARAEHSPIAPAKEGA